MRWPIVILLLAAPARAEPLPSTWLTNDVVLGEMPAAHADWGTIGLGFGASTVVAGHLELEIEAQALKLEPPNDTDPRIGFGLRGVAAIGYDIHVYDRFGVMLEPKVGISTALVLGLGARDRTPDEAFAAVRLASRSPLESSIRGNSRGYGAHCELRLGRSNGEGTGTVLIGWDWGF